MSALSTMLLLAVVIALPLKTSMRSCSSSVTVTVVSSSVHNTTDNIMRANAVVPGRAPSSVGSLELRPSRCARGPPRLQLAKHDGPAGNGCRRDHIEEPPGGEASG